MLYVAAWVWFCLSTEFVEEEKQVTYTNTQQEHHHTTHDTTRKTPQTTIHGEGRNPMVGFGDGRMVSSL